MVLPSSAALKAGQDHQEVAWVPFGREGDGYCPPGSPEPRVPWGGVALHLAVGLLGLNVTPTSKWRLKLLQTTDISYAITKESHVSWQSMFCSQLFIITYAALVYNLLS